MKTLNASIPNRLAIMGNDNVVVQADRLVKVIDQRPILRNISLTMTAGSYVALLGANGAGKSTLLKILATLLPPTQGQVSLFGQVASRTNVELRRRIGLVGHQVMLYRDLSAVENLRFFARLYGLSDVEARCRESLERVGLEKRAADAIKVFSRGMLQRLSIARALLHDPDLLLADEPFSGLDAPATQSIERLFEQLNNDGKTIVLVTHDIEQGLRIAERAVVLRDGKIVLDEPACRLYAREVLSEVSAS